MDLWGSGEVGQDWICLLAVSATFLTWRLRGSCVGCFSGVLELSWSCELKCFEWGFLDLDCDEDESSIGIIARERERERLVREGM